jgi:hypothetical protein
MEYLNGVYVQDAAVLCCVVDFVRGNGASETNSESFGFVQGSTGPYTLLLINGDRGGSNRVRSARISLNGAELPLLNPINQQVEITTARISRLNAGQNVIDVRFDGQPGGHLHILVKDQTPAFAPH